MAQPKISIVRSPDPVEPAPAPDPAAPRYQHGWRSGKPIEDPDKLKRWGTVSAKPSEYLVCTRRGEVDVKRSGQGRRIFKWPWESIAIVPTTLQRIEFTADQITREHVGVVVTGIAVYRIADPLLAFRVLNFTYGEAASEKLAATMREMFIGAVRRSVANLALDDCLTRRKDAIAGYLMQEIAPVVAGEGAPYDAATKGWGVVIDTIEIQQVRIQSQEVFEHLQAPYRAEIAARAELAELDRARAVAEVEAREAARRAEIAATSARRQAELARDKVLHDIQIAEQQRRANAAAEVAALDAERARIEATHTQSLLELAHDHAVRLARQSADLDLRRQQADLELDLRRRDAEARETDNTLEAAHQRRLADIEQTLGQTRALRELVTIGLPQIAAALHASFGTVHYTSIGGPTTSPLDAVPAALAQLLTLARSFGLQIPDRDDS